MVASPHARKVTREGKTSKSYVVTIQRTELSSAVLSHGTTYLVGTSTSEPVDEIL